MKTSGQYEKINAKRNLLNEKLTKTKIRKLQLIEEQKRKYQELKAYALELGIDALNQQINRLGQKEIDYQVDLMRLYKELEPDCEHKFYSLGYYKKGEKTKLESATEHFTQCLICKKTYRIYKLWNKDLEDWYSRDQDGTKIKIIHQNRGKSFEKISNHILTLLANEQDIEEFIIQKQYKYLKN